MKQRCPPDRSLLFRKYILLSQPSAQVNFNSFCPLFHFLCHYIKYYYATAFFFYSSSNYIPISLSLFSSSFSPVLLGKCNRQHNLQRSFKYPQLFGYFSENIFLAPRIRNKNQLAHCQHLAMSCISPIPPN